MNEGGKLRPDLLLLLALILCLMVGIAFGFSSSYVIAEKYTGDPFYFFKRHILSLLLGIIAFGVAYKIKMEIVYKYYIWGLVLACFLLLLVFVPGVGKMVAGSRRWVSASIFQFQSSEIAKFLLILFLSVTLAKKAERMREFWKGVLPPMLLVGVVVVLVAVEPDFSTALLFLFISLFLFYLAGSPPVYLLTILVSALPFILFFLQSKAYLVKRFAFVSPFADPYGKGYHLIQSFLSFKNGGLLGAGPGNSQQKISRLPEAHTDFIFSIIGEEIGLIGALLVIMLFVVIAVRGIRIALRQNDPRAMLLAAGITGFISLEAFFHIGVTLGLVPTTGMPLPFISYGRTALVTKLFMSGILLQLSRSEEPYFFQNQNFFRAPTS